MPAISLTVDKTEITLGQVIEAEYNAKGYMSVIVQTNNLTGPIDLGSDDVVAGTIKFLPVSSGPFTITLSGLGFTDTRINDDSDVVTATVNVK